jgi:uncharacterized membrane protein YfcA
MMILGYFLAVVMGVVLGLLGGGGSILTVPILVYVFSVQVSTATGYSLFIVGVSSVFGFYGYANKRLVDYKVGFIFAVPAFIGVYFSRGYFVPWLPESIFTLNNYEVTKDILILAVFALMMILASISMIRGRKDRDSADVIWDSRRYAIIAVEGLVVGVLTGFVGAGGGFLIIPALVILAGLEMKVAVGTSLMIISIKSLIGFIGDIQTNPNMDWTFLFIFTSFSVVGILLGTYLSKKIPSKKLKPIFGWFVLVMGTIILIKR